MRDLRSVLLIVGLTIRLRLLAMQSSLLYRTLMGMWLRTLLDRLLTRCSSGLRRLLMLLLAIILLRHLLVHLALLLLRMLLLLLLLVRRHIGKVLLLMRLSRGLRRLLRMSGFRLLWDVLRRGRRSNLAVLLLLLREAALGLHG